MRHPLSLLISFAALSALGLALILLPEGTHAQVPAYVPGRAKPAPEFPAEVTLSPKYPLQPTAALFADNCHFDAFDNLLSFRLESGKAGVRFPKAVKEARVVVEFVIRTDRPLQFLLQSTTLAKNETSTTMTIPKGLQRLTVRGTTLTDRDAFAHIRCRSEALWYLISVRVRRE